MATTGKNFVKHTNAELVGSTVASAAAVTAYDPNVATQQIAGGNCSALDKYTVDFSTDSFAKHGVARYALVSTTVKSPDLTALNTGAASNDGDTLFASFSKILVYNDGAAAITFGIGGSNGASLGLGGTTPTVPVGAGCRVVIEYATPVTVDGTHKVIDITPTAGGSVVLMVAGA